MLEFNIKVMHERIKQKLDNLRYEVEKHREAFQSFLKIHHLSQVKNIPDKFPHNVEIGQLAREANHYHQLIEAKSKIIDYALLESIRELERRDKDKINTILMSDGIELEQKGKRRAQLSKKINEMMAKNRANSQLDEISKNKDKIKKFEQEKDILFEEIEAKGIEFSCICNYFEEMQQVEIFIDELEIYKRKLSILNLALKRTKPTEGVEEEEVFSETEVEIEGGSDEEFGFEDFDLDKVLRKRKEELARKAEEESDADLTGWGSDDTVELPNILVESEHSDEWAKVFEQKESNQIQEAIANEKPCSITHGFKRLSQEIEFTSPPVTVSGQKIKKTK